MECSIASIVLINVPRVTRGYVWSVDCAREGSIASFGVFCERCERLDGVDMKD